MALPICIGKTILMPHIVILNSSPLPHSRNRTIILHKPPSQRQANPNLKQTTLTKKEAVLNIT